jgi:hypothetical protein
MESFFQRSAEADLDATKGDVFRRVPSGGEMEVVGPPLAAVGSG